MAWCGRVWPQQRNAPAQDICQQLPLQRDARLKPVRPLHKRRGQGCSQSAAASGCGVGVLWNRTVGPAGWDGGQWSRPAVVVLRGQTVVPSCEVGLWGRTVELETGVERP